MVDAIAVDLELKPHFDPKNRMPEPGEISRFCSSLVIVTPGEGFFKSRDDHSGSMVIQLAHFSVKEYLISGRVYEAFTQAFEETTIKKSFCQVAQAYLSHVEHDFRGQITQTNRKFPFAKYCALYGYGRNWHSMTWDREQRHVLIENDLLRQKRINESLMLETANFFSWSLSAEAKFAI